MRRSSSKPIVGLLLAIGLLPFAGCLQFAANLMHVVSGPQVPAEFKGLENKRVAVVAHDESGICNQANTIRLAGTIRGILANKVPKATFTTQEEIDTWLHGKSSRDQDFVSLGSGVKADYVIAIEMRDLKLKEGPTLYRGRSNLNLKVWDVAGSKVAFTKSLPEYTYPTMASMTTTETDEEKFKRVYLTNVADKLSRYFYAHEFGDDVAMDAKILQY